MQGLYVDLSKNPDMAAGMAGSWSVPAVQRR